MNKKKYHGGLKVLLSLLFIMLLSTCSTCYAIEITEEQATYLWVSLCHYNNNFYGSEFYNLNQRASQNTTRNSSSNINFSGFYNYLKSLNLDFEFNTYKTIGIISYNSWGYFSNNNIYLINTAALTNDDIHLYLKFGNPNGYGRTITIYGIDDNLQYTEIPKVLKITFSKDTSGNAISINSEIISISSNGLALFTFYAPGYNTTNNNNGLNVLNPLFGFCTFISTYNVFTNWNGSSYFSNPQPYLFKSLYTGEQTENNNDLPNNPSGESGSTGTITNPSGDVTGQIDLSGIENGIKDVKNTISGESQAIRDTISGESQAIRDTLTDYDEGLADDTISNFISNMQDSISGELSNSQIIGALEEVENGFKDLITGQAEDFEIHWNDVVYNDVKIIPAGQVNFSKICRDNEVLGNLKEKLNIILSALCGIALIKYLYNLLLATLGIDNPYLYDKVKDEHVNTSSNTNNVRVTAKVPYTSYDKKGNLNGWGRDEK